ncbi:MAG: Ig-like domain-containing protein [Opitutales bacterium]
MNTLLHRLHKLRGLCLLALTCKGILLTANTNLPRFEPSGASFFGELKGEKQELTDPNGPRGLTFYESSFVVPQIWTTGESATLIDHPYNTNPIYTKLSSADFFDFANNVELAERDETRVPLLETTHHNLELSGLPVGDEETVYISLFGFEMGYEGTLGQFDYYISDLGNGNYQETRVYQYGTVELFNYDTASESFNLISSTYSGALVILNIFWPSSGEIDDTIVSLSITGLFDYYSGEDSFFFDFEIYSQSPIGTPLTGTAGTSEVRGFDNPAVMQFDESYTRTQSPPYICDIGDATILPNAYHEINYSVFDADGLDSDVTVTTSVSPQPVNYTQNSSDRFIGIIPTPEELGQTFTVSMIATDSDNITSNATFDITVSASADTVSEVTEIITQGTIPPTISIGSPTTFTENGSAVLVDPSMFISDSEDDFDGTGTLSAQIVSGADTEDRLYITPSGNLTQSGQLLSYMGIHVATLNKNIATGSEALSMTFTTGLNTSNFDGSTPTFAFPSNVVTAIANAITFDTTSDDPGTGRVVRFTAADASALSDQADQSLTIIPVDDPPVFDSIPDFTVQAFDTISFFPTLTDPDSTSFNFTLDTSSLGLGMNIDATTGEFHWTPTASDVPGPYIVTVGVIDDTSLSDSTLFTINVTDVNDPPEPEDDAFGTNESQALTLSFNDLLSNDTDPEGDAFTITFVDGFSALGGIITTDTTNKQIVYETSSVPDLFTLEGGDVLVDSFVYEVTDSEGGESLASVFVTINGEDSPPVIFGFVPTEIFESETFETLVSVSDFDSTAIPVLSGDLPRFAELRFDQVFNGEAFYDLIFAPGPDDIGTYTITLTAENSDTTETTSESYTFEVVDGFQRPFSMVVSDFFVAENQTRLDIPLYDLFDDPDGNDSSLSFDITRNINPFIYESIVFNQQSGILTLTFNETVQGFLDLTIRAVDTDGLSSSVDIFIGVRNDFFGDMQAPAGASAKRVFMPDTIEADMDSVKNIAIAPLATTASRFPTYEWDPTASTLTVEPTATPSRSLLSTTYYLENGDVVEQMFPVTFTSGEIFSSDASVGDNWFYSEALGLYYRSLEWAYHPILGWLYVDATFSDNIYFYSEDHGWMYTSESAFPYVYDTQSKVWKYLYIDSESAFIYNFEESAYSAW